VCEDLARAVLILRPTLAEHACKLNGIGRFADKLVGSTFAHLAEHLAIDFLVEQAQKTGAFTTPVSGYTRWLDKHLGTMSITISSATESAEAVFEAIAQAVALVNHLTAQQTAS
jgi:hypothetical protein